jgi:mono/diheme cytochrome c family protein
MVGRAVACIAAALLVTCSSQAPATAPLAARGQSLYRVMGCPACHEPNSFGRSTGPPLDHVGSVAARRRPGMSAEEYIRQSILEPTAYEVPGYEGFLSRSFDPPLSAADLDALVAYLLTLQ